MLVNDRRILRLLRSNPFAGAPPRFVRARLYRYRFSTRQERAATGDWWVRSLLNEYLSPLSLGRP